MVAKLFAREVRRNGGMVVYLNLTRPQAVWQDLVDYWVEWDCDTWAQDLEERRSVLWVKDTINWPTAGSSFSSPIVID